MHHGPVARRFLRHLRRLRRLTGQAVCPALAGCVGAMANREGRTRGKQAAVAAERILAGHVLQTVDLVAEIVGELRRVGLFFRAAHECLTCQGGRTPAEAVAQWRRVVRGVWEP